MDDTASTRTIQDRYELIEVIGSGGSATVWRAIDTRLNRPVALKLLHAQYAADPSFEKRMQREARHIASLRNQHVVTVYDVGVGDDGPYIVMELVEGPTLRQVLDSPVNLPVSRVQQIAIELLDGLAHAHEQGLIHRDIKPGNILLSADGTAKLTDFGISRSLTQTTEITASHVFTGTFAYSSPEQLSGDAIGPPSDLYSLGCVLYECLGGAPPFDAGDPTHTAYQQRFAQPPAIVAKRPDAKGVLATAVMRCLEKDPRQRYQSAAEMLIALGGVGAGATMHSTWPATVAESGTNVDRDLTAIAVAAPGRRRTRPTAYLTVSGIVVLAAAAVIAILLSRTTGSHSELASGATMTSGQTLASPNGRYQLSMQSQGALLLRDTTSGEPLWSTGTGGHAGAYVSMRADGDFVVESPHPAAASPTPLYRTRTSGHQGATLHVLDSGNVVLTSGSGRVLWQAGSGPASLGSSLHAGEGLHPAQFMSSPHGQFRLIDDGRSGTLRLVPSARPSCALWSEPSIGYRASVAVLLPNGDFVMYAPISQSTWSTGTAGHPGASLTLDDSGGLTLRASSGTVIWHAEQHTPANCSP